MPKLVDRIGHRYGKLMVLSRAGRNELKKVLWKCACDCGGQAVVVSGDLVTGNTQSCGCYLKEKVTKHGGSGKGSYNTWRAMMRRCYKTQDKDYKRYGAKGISVCERWHNYALFAADMGEPLGDQTLDRINPYGDYTPENCRWADTSIQSRNTRVRANSKTGVVGVSKTHSGTYMAKITVKHRSFYSKCFATIEEAAAARKQLELKHWSAA
jgi:hypothetical protein